MQKVLSMNTYRASTLGYRAFLVVKRSFDIIFSLVAIVILSPALLILSVIVAFDTKAFPIFVQVRMGRNNQPFNIFKFRTMFASAPVDVATSKLANSDEYISKFGKLLRRTSIDELPQLLNILFGQMSFVGPRPVVLTETDLLELRTRNGACSVRPGLTGIAQTSGRDKITISEKAKMDAFYANNMSLSLDSRVIVQSIGYVLRSKDIQEGAQSSSKNEVNNQSA
ncbi:MAG: sugar transferase [Oscillospiraceae bacterium]|nr:sugar transferase [Oscillospiraceae bacterium]